MVTARSQPASDGAQLVSGDGLLDRETILEPFDPDSCLLQVHLVLTKRDRLADAQTMAIHHQDQQVGLEMKTSAQIHALSGDANPCAFNLADLGPFA